MQSRQPYFKHKQTENKINKINLPKDYQDEQDTLALKPNDSYQVKDIKAKMKVVMAKLTHTKKQKENLHQENQILQKEVMNLQNSLRHMVSGFCNSSSSFPIANEMASKIAQFYKCQCLDTFFDLLCPEELTIKGIVQFYYLAFNGVNSLIQTYFDPCNQVIKTIGCFQNIEGPIMNVLRKAFQSKHQEILQKIINQEQVQRIAMQIYNQLKFNSMEANQAIQQISDFLRKMIELMLQCKISDPPLQICLKSLGKKVIFNSLQNDPLDGFIKGREECYIILPEVRKSQNSELVTKSLVLQKNYDLSN